MINIVTGNINSGKTSKLAAIYQFNNEGDGFVAVKVMNDSVVTGYRAMRLSTMEERQFIVRDSVVPAEFDSVCQIGPYLVSRQGLEWIERETKAMIESKMSPIYLDEIGLLELDGKCLDRIFQELLSTEIELYISVRNELVDRVLQKYHITDYRLM
jgi:nucleoside-triphosphatase THEP1